MARYIDADALKERLREIRIMPNTLYGMGINAGIDKVVTAIEAMPTADVVPKSEIARLQEDVDRLLSLATSALASFMFSTCRLFIEIFEEFENILDSMIKLNYSIGVQHEDPLERAKAISAEQALRAFRDYVAELKKKYQEGEPNGKNIKE